MKNCKKYSKPQTLFPSLVACAVRFSKGNKPIKPKAMNWRSKRDRMAVTFVSHGHWRVDIYSDYPRRIIKSCITTDSQAVDDFKADEWEKYGRYNVRKMGTETLWNEVQSKSRTNKQAVQ